jgi:hypothetical protein
MSLEKAKAEKVKKYIFSSGIILKYLDVSWDNIKNPTYYEFSGSNSVSKKWVKQLLDEEKLKYKTVKGKYRVYFK